MFHKILLSIFGLSLMLTGIFRHAPIIEGVIFNSIEDTIIARSKHNENGKFFAYLFRSSAWRYQIRKRVNGVKVYSITQKILGTASVLIPPKNEQAEIVEYLDDICGRVDAIIENLYKRIDIFHEYRTRLISDVVTGQIDVRGIEIPDYEYVEEESDEETDETEGADEEVEEQEE